MACSLFQSHLEPTFTHFPMSLATTSTYKALATAGRRWNVVWRFTPYKHLGSLTPHSRLVYHLEFWVPGGGSCGAFFSSIKPEAMTSPGAFTVASVILPQGLMVGVLLEKYTRNTSPFSQYGDHSQLHYSSSLHQQQATGEAATGGAITAATQILLCRPLLLRGGPANRRLHRHCQSLPCLVDPGRGFISDLITLLPLCWLFQTALEERSV